MMILGFVLAGLMGILLGLLGGGGSILTVPILAYLMGVSTDDAPSYSLFVVGMAAAVGGVQYVRSKQFSAKAVLFFGLPSMVAVFLNQRFVRPAIPEVIRIGDGDVTRGTLLMGLFALMMLLAGWSMVRKKQRQNLDAFEVDTPEVLKPVALMLAGLLEGGFTGLVGAGGGFIIVPALVIIAKLPMKRAVGTSLVIMAVKSLIGFGGALNDVEVNWTLLLPFTGIAMAGIVLGAQLSKRVPAVRLKLYFGWFVLFMAAFVAVKTWIDA